MGGTVLLRSKQGAGTSVTAIVPFKIPSASATAFTQPTLSHQEHKTELLLHTQPARPTSPTQSASESLLGLAVRRRRSASAEEATLETTPTSLSLISSNSVLPIPRQPKPEEPSLIAAEEVAVSAQKLPVLPSRIHRLLLAEDSGSDVLGVRALACCIKLARLAVVNQKILKKMLGSRHRFRFSDSF